jgi:Na+-transporting NADH:ubiquinone oxidoreductase subunit A
MTGTVQETMQNSYHRDVALLRCDQVAILGADFPGLRIKPAVAEGDTVSAGQPLFHDRKRSQIAFIAPVDGRVSAIRYGAKRLFSSLVIDCSPGADVSTASTDSPAGPIDADTRDTLVSTLAENGFWPSFIQRPFGGMPDPQGMPDAIFVTATPAGADAPDPRSVLEGRLDAFARALQALTMLTDGPVFLCQHKGADLMPALAPGVRCVKFPAKAGFNLAGTHVHRQHPVGLDRRVWTVGYQDVAAIGHFLLTGEHDFTRMVAARRSDRGPVKIVRVPLGARLLSVLNTSAPAQPKTTWQMETCPMSGSGARAREAVFLGRFHEEVTRRPARRIARSTQAEPIVAHAGLDAALAMNLLTVPLMRALSVGDVESAERLGCLELLEEDVAALSAFCTSGTDYGRCLRRALDALQEAA